VNKNARARRALCRLVSLLLPISLVAGGYQRQGRMTARVQAEPTSGSARYITQGDPLVCLARGAILRKSPVKGQLLIGDRIVCQGTITAFICQTMS
jgi:hypothetical protein